MTTPLDTRWRWRHLLLAVHRLSFFLALVVLMALAVWWALVQGGRSGWLPALPAAIAPTIVHSVAMTFGFMPLLFAGFLFTAGPRWLGVEPAPFATVIWPLGLQAAGWLLWLLGAFVDTNVALTGLGLALLGLCGQQALFWRLVVRSRASDKRHALTIGMAGLIGCLSLGAVLFAIVEQAYGLARAAALGGLWAFITVTFVTVAHRMIPFFTAGVLPARPAWRPTWILALLVGGAVFEAASAWAEWAGVGWMAGARPGMLVRGLIELSIGSVLLWIGIAWGLFDSLRIRLLAMLHIGFIWMAIAFLLAGLSQLLGFRQGAPFFGLGVLHALTMGALGSLLMAMVTRVACGHSGRPLQADGLTWSLFLLLQVATGLRLVGAWPGTSAVWVTVAATAWAAVLVVWACRLIGWFGRLRLDGEPG